MKLVAIDKLPDGRKYHKVQRLIEEFANSDAKFCKIEIEPGEYKSRNSAWNSIGRTARRMKIGVKVRSIEKTLYLVKEI